MRRAARPILRRRRSGRAWEEGFDIATLCSEDKRSRGLGRTSRASEQRQRSRGGPPPRDGAAPTTPASAPPASSLLRVGQIAPRWLTLHQEPSTALVLPPILPVTRPIGRSRRSVTCRSTIEVPDDLVSLPRDVSKESAQHRRRGGTS